MNKLKFCEKGSPLNVLAFGAGFGISWALGVFLLGILAMIFSKHHYGSAFIHLLASVYIGYAATLKGIIIGTFWAAIDGFIWGFVIAWIYNAAMKLCCKR